MNSFSSDALSLVDRACRSVYLNHSYPNPEMRKRKKKKEKVIFIRPFDLPQRKVTIKIKLFSDEQHFLKHWKQ